MFHARRISIFVGSMLVETYRRRGVVRAAGFRHRGVPAGPGLLRAVALTFIYLHRYTVNDRPGLGLGAYRSTQIPITAVKPRPPRSRLRLVVAPYGEGGCTAGYIDVECSGAAHSRRGPRLSSARGLWGAGEREQERASAREREREKERELAAGFRHTSACRTARHP